MIIPRIMLAIREPCEKRQQSFSALGKGDNTSQDKYEQGQGGGNSWKGGG